MPKEFIENQFFGQYATEVTEAGKPDVKVPLSNHALKVGWSKEQGHVEVAVVDCIGGVFNEHGFAEGEPRPQYMSLDRHGINRAIRTLRKARDQSFGSDA